MYYDEGLEGLPRIYHIFPELKDKRLEELNQRLGEVEQKLVHDPNLCREIANLIDMSIETKKVVDSLNGHQTRLPVIRGELDAVAQKCLADYEKRKEDVLNSIKKYIAGMNPQPKASTKYYAKIIAAINKCIEEYPIYRLTQYSKIYGSSPQTQPGIDIAELLA